MIDTGIRSGAAGMHAAVRAWSDQPLHSVVFTHGHVDHVFGLKPFLEFVAQHERFSPEIARRLGNPALDAISFSEPDLGLYDRIAERTSDPGEPPHERQPDDEGRAS